MKSLPSLLGSPFPVLGSVLLALCPLLLASDPNLPGGHPIRPKPSRHGPFRNDPAQGIPKHAYSPFDNIGKPPPYEPAPGRDYVEGHLVIKLAPNVRVNRYSIAPAGPGAPAIKLTDSSSLNQMLNAHGISALAPVFPQAKPPVAKATVPGEPPPIDLTRWYRAISKSTVRQTVEMLTNDPGVEVAEPDYIRKPVGRGAGGEGGMANDEWRMTNGARTFTSASPAPEVSNDARLLSSGRESGVSTAKSGARTFPSASQAPDVSSDARFLSSGRESGISTAKNAKNAETSSQNLSSVLSVLSEVDSSSSAFSASSAGLEIPSQILNPKSKIINSARSASLPASTSDPLFDQSWHLSACKIPEAWAWLEAANLPAGGNRDIVVAVIDTGIDYTHPDLAANIWTNPGEFGLDTQDRDKHTNGIDDDGDGFVDDVHGARVEGTHSGNPMDDHGHGTHVAGIIAAQGANGQGGVGVAYNVQIMAIKAAQYSGVLAASDVAEAIDYAVAHGADIINMSFGGYAKSQVEEDALAVAFGQCVLVAAAGNDGKVDLPCPFGADMYPAAYNWVLGVMASTQVGGLAGFSNYDCTPHDKHEYEVMAPGVDVWSTLPNNQYAAWDGTSMATPIVSGIAALARTKWSDKDVYSSRFIMGQIAMNSGAVANAINTLTNTPRPELSYLEHWLFDTSAQAAVNDNDGRVDAGETLDLAIVIRNHWGKADPVTVKLEAWAEGAFQPDPYVTMLIDTVDYGAVGSFNWDDNGLIYDPQGVITGVRHPFTFTVWTNCPNDHVIPFKLTMTCRNGLDTTDTTDYAFTSRFTFVVQRGRELPRIISTNMTLTKDYLWIVSGQTLVETGVVLVVAAGTQVQWGSPEPQNPYSEGQTPYVQVEGILRAEGTFAEPVELFPSSLLGGLVLIEVRHPPGASHLWYSRVLNPQTQSPYGWWDMVDHSDIYAENSAPSWKANVVSNTMVKFHQGVGNFDLFCADVCLIEGAGGYWLYNERNNVFLQRSERDSAWGPTIGYVTAWGSEAEAGAHPEAWNNAFLSKYWDPNINHWMRFWPYYQLGRDKYIGISSNFWGTTSTILIDAAIYDFNDDINTGHIVYQPILTGPAATTYPFVADVTLWPGAPTTPPNSSVLELKGEDYVHIATTPLLQNLDAVTVEAWIKCADPNRGQFIYNDHNIYYRWMDLSVRNDAGIEFIVFGSKFSSLPGLVPASEWVHIAATYAGASGTAQLYVNGLPVTTSFEQLYGGTIKNSDVAIGAYPNGAYPETMFRGHISEFRRWNAVRTSEQIQQNYDKAVDPSSEPGLIGYWKLNGNAQDSTGYGHHGSLVGDPAFVNPIKPPVSTYSTSLGTVGAGRVTFTVFYNRDMDTNVAPQVTFGPDTPVTDYTVHPVNGGWADARTWLGTFNITPITGDGYQLMRIAGGRAADDPWLVCGEDSGRFRFEIITSGTESMNLQATGGEGKVDLNWMQDDFELLAGYNLYRSTSQSGTYSRINQFIIPSQQKTFTDTNVVPGQPYYYKFKVVKSDMSESDFSNVASGTPLDTIPPVLTHTPVTSAAPGLPLTLTADVTDNVGVQSVTLFFRTAAAVAPQANWETPDISKASIGARTILSAGEDHELAHAPGGLESPRSFMRSFMRSAIAAQSTEAYTSREMTRPGGTGNRYAATIEGSRLASPGLEYYIEATDGVSTVRSPAVAPGFPYTVTVVDKPVITAATPSHGSATGGTVVTIAGANFKTGASVTFGGAPASSVTVVSGNQITCSTPPHFPATVDVAVANPDGQSGILLRGYTFESDVVSLSLPNTGGGQHAIVSVPINAANVQGLAAASLTVTFEGGVLTGRNARTGTLTPGWSIAANNTAGQMRLSMASPGGTVAGSGVLAWIEFEVEGAPGSTTPLRLASVLLNGGAIPTQTAEGSFAVNLVFDVSGTVRFWKDNAGVPGVTFNLVGDRVYSGTSAANGSYTVAGAEAGNCTLTPAKSEDVRGISAYDASLVLQHDVGLINLAGSEAVAADVDKSGGINSMDAFYILQAAVQLINPPFPGAGKVWEFSPANRTYANLNANLSGQDFTAILIGDVSGNWSGAIGPLSVVGGPGAAGFRIDDLGFRIEKMGEMQGAPSRPFVNPKSEIRNPKLAAPVVLAIYRSTNGAQGNQAKVLFKSATAAIYSVDLKLAYDPAWGVKSVRSGDQAATMALASNTNQAGVVRSALAGALPLPPIGELLAVSWAEQGTSTLHVVEAQINEGSVPVRIEPNWAAFESDTDEDGQTDLDEIRAGSDPNMSKSVFKVTGVAANSDGSKTVTWLAVPGKSYRVVCREGVEEGVWKELGEAIKAEGPTASYVDRTATTSRERIYRVKLIE